VTDAEVIDASNMIVMPGFIDTHRHLWEGILRNIGVDYPLEGEISYLAFVLNVLAPVYRPEDVYAGNLISTLGAINAGVTTILESCSSLLLKVVLTTMPWTLGGQQN
jgi:5-methylthioadenosine/S-adenosylhomocysteine deaminase